jgi:uncharacterized protein
MRQEFSPEELIKIVNNINSYAVSKDIPVFKIGLVGSGEPLLEYESIKDLIEYVVVNKFSRLSFYTITNATLLNDKHLQFFNKYKDTIALNISLDGFEEIHNTGKERYEDVMKSILAYENVFGEKPAINCTVHRETIKHRDALLAFFQDEEFQNITFSILVDTIDEGLKISKKEYINFLSECKKYPFSVRQLKEDKSKKYDCTMYGKLCGVGKTNIFITRSGIYPCGRFYGNEGISYGQYHEKFSVLEEKISAMHQLVDGECYYDKYMVGGDK